MKLRFAVVVGWLAGADVLPFALFWLLLRVPESNLLMLAASVALAVAIVVIAGCIETVSLLALRGAPLGSRLLRRGISGVLPFAAALALFGVAWWATGRFDGWWGSVRGEIDAWLIARFNWTSTGWLHAAIGWLSAFVRWVVGLSLALALFAGLVCTEGAERSGGRLWWRWMGAAFSPRALAGLAALIVLFAWAPWQVVYWRPSWLAPSWPEAAFVAAKLGTLYLLANAGWALALLLANRERRSGTPAPSSAS
jgi:hypothetical protein